MNAGSHGATSSELAIVLVPLWLLLRFMAEVALFSVTGGRFSAEHKEHIERSSDQEWSSE